MSGFEKEKDEVVAVGFHLIPLYIKNSIGNVRYVGELYNIREVGPEYVMKPGEGYWIHVPADSTLIVNW